MLPAALLARYHSDSESVYHTWFLDPGRLKAFRTIRRGIQALVQDLEVGMFANDYRGSTLETVVEAIAEQKQVFAGAAHPQRRSTNNDDKNGGGGRRSRPRRFA